MYFIQNGSKRAASKAAGAASASGAAKAKGKEASPAPASEPDPNHPATREARMDQDRQAEALETAAAEGVPFCEECEKKKQARAAEAEQRAAEA